jgi:hypothetical protein
MTKAKSKKWYQDVAVITTLITVLGGGVFALLEKTLPGNTAASTNPSATPAPVNVTVINNNEQTNNNNPSPENPKQELNPQKKKTIAITGLAINESMLSEILKKTSFNLSKDQPDIQLEISHTGKITLLKNGLYWYPGGRLVIKRNKVVCPLELSCELSNTLPAGNTEDYVQQKINEMAAGCIEKNKEAFIKSIITCLK